MEFDNTTLIVLVVAVIVIFMMTQRKKEKWTYLAGAPQKWHNLPRSKHICDTEYNDEKCKETRLCAGGNIWWKKKNETG